MDSRRFIPLTILALLSVLTAAFAVLAVATAPRGASHAVQGAADASFGADSFSVQLTITVSAGTGTGTLTQVRSVTYDAALPGTIVVRNVETGKLLGTEHGTAVTTSVHGYLALAAGSTPWVGSGSHFTRTESFAEFAKSSPQRTTPRGTVFETATISQGLLADITLKVVIPSQTAGGTSSSVVTGERLRLLRINGDPVPPVNS
ncbi:MAG TPA: hypothetical protein VGL48_01590 [Acidimicrobiales bacterium]|jgi:hypothetical protein